MPRGRNAQIAADMYNDLRSAHNWPVTEAWTGVALLLLTCEVYHDRKWQPLVANGNPVPFDVVVHREKNDFRRTKKGKPNATVRRADQLSLYLAQALGLPRTDLCRSIGLYWGRPGISSLQPHNLAGNAFRSAIVEILRHYGAAGITYIEEYDARALFPGYALPSRSEEPKIDILALKGDRPVALLSTRWRYRHDRVDFIEEAHSYSPLARRIYRNCPYYAVTGEFNPARLAKIVSNTPNPIHAGVHFCPNLITEGLGENGRITGLRDLEYLVQESKVW